MRLRQCDHLGPGVLPVLPDGLAPAADDGVALGTRRGGEDVGNPDGRALRRHRRRDPIAALASKSRVRPLHLSAGEALFEIEIQSDQSEDDGDRLAARAGMLHRVRINDVLMDELRIAEFERVESELGIEVLIGRA